MKENDIFKYILSNETLFQWLTNNWLFFVTMTQILKLLLVVIVTLYHIENSMASFRQMTNGVEDIYVQPGRANKG